MLLRRRDGLCFHLSVVLDRDIAGFSDPSVLPIVSVPMAVVVPSVATAAMVPCPTPITGIPGAVHPTSVIPMTGYPRVAVSVGEAPVTKVPDASQNVTWHPDVSCAGEARFPVTRVPAIVSIVAVYPIVVVSGI